MRARALHVRFFTLLIIASFLWIGCAAISSTVETEASYWGAFSKVIEGPMQSGINQLPVPVHEAHCYRVILAARGAGVPQLRFQGEIDADSVGFPIVSIPTRGPSTGESAVVVYGFCSQGSGTIQLQANMPSEGYGAMYEAAYTSLDANQGPDVQAVAQWLATRQQEEAARRAQQEQERQMVVLQQFVQTTGPQLREQLHAIVRGRGRYNTSVIDDVRSSDEWRESLALEPGSCYIFGVLPHQNTEVHVDLSFQRIRNSAQRSDEQGSVIYTLCIAPSGPIQEASFVVQARPTPDGSQSPLAFALNVLSRQASPAERRAADQEWLSNDPEARIDR